MLHAVAANVAHGDLGGFLTWEKGANATARTGNDPSSTPAPNSRAAVARSRDSVSVAGFNVIFLTR
jgi:hypothetical protein